MILSRRTFLGIGGGVAAGAAAAAVAGPVVWRDLVDHQVHSSRASGSAKPAGNGRVLVVLSLGGGNDGLNTLVPAGQGAYHDARPTLGLADDTLVTLRGTTAYGLNPNLAPLERWWDAKQLVAVDGMAIPGQSRSHFLASDVWWTADPEEPHSAGWLGRWLDADREAHNPLRAISVGLDTEILNARNSVATVVADPEQFTLMTPRGVDADTLARAFLATSHPSSTDATMAACQQAIPDALGAVDTLTPVLTGSRRVQFAASDSTNAISPSAATAASAATAKGSTGEGVTITSLLEVAAGIIDLRVGTRVIVAAVSGFDTHADQAVRHPLLLTDLAQGIDGFLSTMAARGHADDVLLVTTSEFGRRVAENGSGTDHGEASVHFLAGGKVNGGQVVGQADLAKLDQGDLPIEIDTRSVYATALDWLGGPTDQILGAHYDRYGLVT